MQFQIPVDIFVRLAGVTKRMPNSVNEAEQQTLKCVRLEIKNGIRFAIASNRKIAAIYHLGDTDQPNGCVHIVTDDALIKQCETEKPYNSNLDVFVIPELQTVSLKTTLGYNFPGNGGIFPSFTPLDKWNEWVPKEPVKKANGAMAWTLDDMVALNSASPSGKINFPEIIDVNKPVVLRDREHGHWVGLFMSNMIDEETGKSVPTEPATLPDWWNA